MMKTTMCKRVAVMAVACGLALAIPACDSADKKPAAAQPPETTFGW